MNKDVLIMGIVLVIFRVVVAGILAYGAVLLALEGKEAWGWMLFGAIALGAVTITQKGTK